ncbi:MAG: hypothetical protein AAB438_03310 [Patescibacteria group bacterium]
MEPTMEKKSNGALIGSIIVILVLVLGGVYVWMSKTNEPATQEIQENNTNNQNTVEGAAAIQAYDELSNIEQDLNNTTVEDITVDVETVN